LFDFSQDYTLFINEEGKVYGCGSLKNGKLGLLVNAQEELSLSVPRLIGQKSILFKNIVEVKAGYEHTLALNYEIDDSRESLASNKQGTIFTFGISAQGVLGQGKRGVSIEGIPYMIKKFEFYFAEQLKTKNVNTFLMPRPGKQTRSDDKLTVVVPR
jgi:Regulator of chromosome condensation (RCC1) repeat